MTRESIGQTIRRALIVLTLVIAPLTLALYLNTESNLAAWVFVGVALTSLVATFVLRCSASAALVSAPEVAWAAYLLTLAVTTLLARATLDGVAAAMQFQSLFSLGIWCGAVFVIATAIAQPKDLSIFVRTLDAIGVVIASSVILSAMGWAPGEVQASDDGLRRVFGLFGDSVAYVLALFLLRGVASASAPIVILNAIALVLTRSLGALVVLGMGVLILIATAPRASIRAADLTRRIGSWVLGVVGLAVVVSLVALALYERAISNPAESITALNRLGAFQLALAVFADHPWVGVGYNGFGALVVGYSPEDFFAVFSENYVAQAQNQWLQTGVDAGALGILILACVAWLVTSRLICLSKHAPMHRAAFRAYGAWIAAMFIANQFAVWLLPFSIVSFAFAALAGVSCTAGVLSTTTTSEVRQPE
jgi:hypothetical protein